MHADDIEPGSTVAGLSCRCSIVRSATGVGNSMPSATLHAADPIGFHFIIFLQFLQGCLIDLYINRPIGSGHLHMLILLVHKWPAELHVIYLYLSLGDHIIASNS